MMRLFVTLFLAGFTPLPFKVFTITSGMIGFNILIFLTVCFISRGLRFFLVSYLSMKVGDKIGDSLEKHSAIWSTIIGIVIVFFFSILYFLIR